MKENHADDPVLDECSATSVAKRTTSAGVSRRRLLRGGGLLGIGSLLGATGGGVDRTAAEEIDSAAGGGCNRPEEVVHLDYGAHESWEDIYRMSNGDRENLTTVSSPTYDGDTALQLRIQEGDHWGLSTHYDFDDGLLELNGRVAFALNTSWSMRTESEHCRLWNCAMSLGEGSAGGGIPDGTNGWSNRLYVSTRGTDSDGPFHLLSYTYHMDQNQDHDFLLQEEPYAVRQPEIVPGRWYEFEYYICVNTVDDDGVANSDGVIQYWLDSDLIYERNDLRFTEDHENNIIETTGPTGHYGGRYVAPENLYPYYANHSMALNGTFGDGC